MTTAMDFLTALRRGLECCRLSATSVLIGVSGGADSVALFRGLLILRDEFSLSLHAAHLNHKLRGAASDADARWVQELCIKYDVRAETGIVELDPAGSGIEEAARVARHRFLSETAARLGCQAITTAHTADDQVETVLHHVFRGSGVAGLRGIPAERLTESGCRLVRPMLSIRREMIEGYLAEIGQSYCQDATNADTSMTRNWLRHELLPQLRTHFGPRLDLSLIRLAEQARDIEDCLSILATRLVDAMILDVLPDVVRLNVRGLADQPLHLVREAFCTLWQRQKWPRQAMGFTEWNRIAHVAIGGGTTNLPGNVVVRHHPPGLLVIEKTNR